MNVLVVNSGGNSLKLTIFDYEKEKLLFKVSYTNLNEFSKQTIRQIDSGKKIEDTEVKLNTYKQAISDFLETLVEQKVIKDINQLHYVIHRVVHGAERFDDPIEIDDYSIIQIKKLIPMAPLHNPINIECINLLKENLENSRHFAVFDTSFHKTIPEKNFRYALPQRLYKKYKIRKYGFHGESHKFISNQVSKILKVPKAKSKVISCHLGGGQSICALYKGESYDTSMGFTPLEGLPMDTRAGSFDPEVILFLLEKGFTSKEIKDIINKESGLLCLSKESNSYKDVEKGLISGCEDSKLINDMLTSRIVKIIGGYISEMQGVDAIVFTGGIGENSYKLREKVLESFEFLGLKLDKSKNEKNQKEISSKSSKIKVYVIPTNEEIQMLKDVKKVFN